MTTLRRDLYQHDQLRANDYDDVRLSEVAEERCGLCYDRWPRSMMRDNDGVRRCPDCYEERDQFKINEILQYDNDQRARRQTRPQVSFTPLKETAQAFVRQMEDASGNRVWLAAPLALSRGGAAVSLLVRGGNFTSANSTFTYTTGVTDSSAPSLTGSTLWTLSLAAASNMAAGQWHVTFNNHTYRNILQVR